MEDISGLVHHRLSTRRRRTPRIQDKPAQIVPTLQAILSAGIKAAQLGDYDEIINLLRTSFTGSLTHGLVALRRGHSPLISLPQT